MHLIGHRLEDNADEDCTVLCGKMDFSTQDFARTNFALIYVSIPSLYRRFLPNQAIHFHIHRLFACFIVTFIVILLQNHLYSFYLIA